MSANTSTTSTREQDTILLLGLRTLGLPETITTEGFERLLQEPEARAINLFGAQIPSSHSAPEHGLRGILWFLATHLVGRQEVHTRRQVIVRAKGSIQNNQRLSVEVSETSEERDSNQPGNRVQATLLSTLARRDLAYRGLAALRFEQDAEHERIFGLDNRNKALESRIRSKRELLLTLTVLKRREEARLRRLGECGMLLHFRGIRKESKRIMSMLSKAFDHAIPPIPISNTPLIPKTYSQYRNTNNELAKLCRLHIRQTGMVQQRRSPDDASLVKAQLKQLLHRTGVAHHDTGHIVERLIALATHRAADVIQALGVDNNYTPLDEDLHTMATVLQQKTKLFQAKLDRCIALEYMCEKLIHTITAFRTEVGPNLQSALFEEAYRVEGYLDLLRRRVEEENNISGIQTGQTPRIDGVGETKILLQRISESRRLTQITRPLVDFVPIQNMPEVEKAIEEQLDIRRNEQLLERKSKKADHGWVIGDDVRALLADIKRLR